MEPFVTPTEMASELGVDPRTLRAWLRQKRAAGDRRLSDHVPRSAWRLDPGVAWDLSREFASEKLGEAVHDVRGPHAWLNWHAFSAGRPRRTSPRTTTSQVLATWEEHAMYSDAGIRGQLAIGPYEFINTLARESSGVGGSALRIVLRAYDHLGDPDSSTPIEDEDVTSYFAGGLAEELAAVLSLGLSRRMRAGGVVRRAYGNADSPGSPTELEHHPPVLIRHRGAPMLPHVAKVADLDAARPFVERYAALGEGDAIAVARAASQFADGLWLADADPRLAWIKLVGAVESAAVRWDAAKDEGPVEQLRRHRKRVYNAIKDCGDDVVRRVAHDLAGAFKPTVKFKDFILAFDPGPPEGRPETGRFDWDTLDDALGWIYEHRSRELHAGIAFPYPLCEPPPVIDGIPLECFPSSSQEPTSGPPSTRTTRSKIF